MAKKKSNSKVRDYRHDEKRKNNPPIGMVSYEPKISEPKMNRYADETSTEPLTPEEKRIITRISRTFPEEQMVYDAAHREKIWEEKTLGEIIPYSNSTELTEL